MEKVTTIVCPNCGANSTNHHNCEYCGSMLIRFVEHGITLDDSKYGKKAKVIPGLEGALKSNLSLQKNRIEGHLIITEINTDIGNYQIVPTSDATYDLGVDNPFVNKEDIGLVMRIPFLVRSKDSFISERERNNLLTVQNLDCYRLFSTIENQDGIYLLLDCGGDYETAARLLSSVIYSIYNPTSITCDTLCVSKGKLTLDEYGMVTHKKNKYAAWVSLLIIILSVIFCIVMFTID